MNQNITPQIEVVERSEIGLKRNVNQDAIGVRLPQTGQPGSHALFIVADGVGGNLPKGEVASHTAVQAMLGYYYAESDETDMLTRVGDALQDTNLAVRQQAVMEGVNNIGTTIVGLALAPNGEAIGFNVGDSRLYRIRGNDIERISEDQISLPEPGVLKDEFKSRRITKIAAYIGQPNPLEPNFYRLKTQPDDTYLLCSDGVWSKIPDEELFQIINHQPLEQASERLVKLVYERNAPDNLSLVLIRLAPTRTPATASTLTEMPTAVMTSSPRQEASRSRILPLLLGVGVVIAAAIGGIGLLSQQQASSSPTPPAITQMGLITATPQETGAVDVTATRQAAAVVPSNTVVAASNTPKPTVTQTPIPRPSATSTLTPSPTDLPPTATLTKTPTVLPSATPTNTKTNTPTTEPTVALAAPTETPTKRPTATDTPQPTSTPSPAPTATPTLLPTDTLAPTTTINPTLITHTPSPTFTRTPTLTRTPTATLTPSATFTATRTPNAAEAAATGTAFARITPSPMPTLFVPNQNAQITLSQPVMLYPSTDDRQFTLPDTSGVELPAQTVVTVLNNLAEPIDNVIYSYIVVEGEPEQKGWAALAPAAQVFVVAHLGSGVIIRKGPAQAYERAGLGLKDGERAVVLGKVTYKGQLWFYVDPENQQAQAGWVWSGVRDLEVQGSLANVPIRNAFPIEPTPLPTPTETATETATVTG